MKQKPLPSSRKRRALLYDKKISREELIRYGDAFFDHGRYVEAAEFYGKARHPEGMDRIRALAKETGDTFLLEIACKDPSCPDGGDPTVWEEVGRKALELQKYSHAVRAFRKAGNETLLEEAQRLFKGVTHSGKA